MTTTKPLRLPQLFQALLARASSAARQRPRAPLPVVAPVEVLTLFDEVAP